MKSMLKWSWTTGTTNQETQTGFIIDQIIIISRKNNIPSIFYFSGIHEDYHKPTDTMEKLSFKKITSLTKLIFFTAWELSNAPKRPVVDKKNTFD